MCLFSVFLLVVPVLLLVVAVQALAGLGPLGWLLALALVLGVVLGSALLAVLARLWWRSLGPDR